MSSSRCERVDGGVGGGVSAEFWSVLASDEAAFVLVCLPRTGTLDADRLETAA